jgi:outer membrane receptor protein involved in Fe transport
MLRSWGVGIALSCVASAALRAEPAHSVIHGRVVDGRGTPVRDATVTREVNAAAAAVKTDADGRFALDGVAAGDTLVVTKDGYAAALATAPATDDAGGDVVLRPEGEAGQGGQNGEVITVRGELPPAAPGAMRASRGELQSMPGTGGDLMQAVSAMPGVAATALPLGATGVVIRGSSPQDSKILVDDFEVPVLYHALGFRSIVRESAIDSLDYLPGGFDVSTGRATSGIVSLTTRAGGDGPRVEADNSTGDIGVLAQGRSGDLRYMIAVRRSTIDLLLPLVLPDDLDLSFATVPRYYDEQLRLDYHVSPHWDLRFSSLGSDDALDLYTDRNQNRDHHFSDHTRFLRGIAAARYSDGPWRAQLALSGIAEQHDSELGAVQHLHVTAPAITARGEVERRADDALGLSDLHWRLGGEAVHTRYGLEVALPRDSVEGETMSAYDPADTSLHASGRIITDDLAAWTQLAASAGPRVHASAGVRVDDYRRTGDVVVEPRGDIAVRLTPTLVARASAGTYSRPPEYQSELLATTLHPERATQLIAGVVYEPLDGARIQASVYDTERSGLATRSATGELTSAGRGTSYGAELTATLRRGPWFAWLSYSYSHATRIDAPGDASRTFDFDQPHHLEALASYRTGGWTFGARFRLLSGLPYTPVMATLFDSDRNLYLPIYGPVNSARTELHHELDLRIERRSTWGPLQITRYLDVQNVYLNQTAVTYLYSYDYSQRMALRWLPILPIIGVRVAW